MFCWGGLLAKWWRAGGVEATLLQEALQRRTGVLGIQDSCCRLGKNTWAKIGVFTVGCMDNAVPNDIWVS